MLCTQTSEVGASEELVSRLRTTRLLEALTTDDLEEVANYFDEFTAVRGAQLFAQRGEADYFYVVLSGRVKLLQRGVNGRRRLRAVLGPSDHFGEEALTHDGRRLASAMVVADSRLARVDGTLLTKWLLERPDRAAGLLHLVMGELVRVDLTLSDHLELDTAGRTAKQLLLFADRFGYRRGPDRVVVPHGLSQAELAQLVGSSRETICKVLSDFSRRGWVELEPQRVIILDRRRLAVRAKIEH